VKRVNGGGHLWTAVASADSLLCVALMQSYRWIGFTGHNIHPSCVHNGVYISVAIFVSFLATLFHDDLAFGKGNVCVTVTSKCVRTRG
jgi:hypothetical protein